MTKYIRQLSAPLALTVALALGACTVKDSKSDTSLATDSSLNKDLAHPEAQRPAREGDPDDPRGDPGDAGRRRAGRQVVDAGPQQPRDDRPDGRRDHDEGQSETQGADVGAVVRDQPPQGGRGRN